MSWVRVDDNLGDHPKLEELSDAAFRLHIRAMCWSQRHATGGRVPDGSLPGLARGKAIKRLTTELQTCVPIPGKAPLWERVEGGWQMHDWGDFNSTAEQADERKAEIRRKRQEAGRQGAARRWQTDSKPDGKTDGTCHAPEMANAIPDGWQTDGPQPQPQPQPLSKSKPPPPSKTSQVAREPAPPGSGGGGSQKFDSQHDLDALSPTQRALRWVRDPGVRIFLKEPCEWPDVLQVVERYRELFPGQRLRLRSRDRRAHKLAERMAEGVELPEMLQVLQGAALEAEAGTLQPQHQRIEALFATSGQVDRFVGVAEHGVKAPTEKRSRTNVQADIKDNTPDFFDPNQFKRSAQA